MKRKLIELWKNSFILKWVDNHYTKKFLKKLENDNFTILCSNCVGGIIYHRAKKKFLSPTINMFFSQPDFVEFCLHLDEYLHEKLCFIENDMGHPVATLGDDVSLKKIKLYFNHAKTEDEANNDWEKRKQRIDRDNLYIMLYNLDGITIDEIKKLENVKCNNKIVLTATPLPEISWSYQIEPVMTHKYPSNYLERDMFNRFYLEKVFDVPGFLNKK